MKKKSIDWKFAPRPIEMMNSPAYRVLSRAAHQVLSRIEIELDKHYRDNGKLCVTYTQLVEYGIHHNAIAAAIRELVALGFIEITEQGRAGNADWRRPTLFRLTYRHTDNTPATNEWRSITEDDATMIAKGARRQGTNSAGKGHHNGKAGQEKQKATPGKRTTPHTRKAYYPTPGKRTDDAKNARNSIVRKPGVPLDYSPSTPLEQGCAEQPRAAVAPPDAVATDPWADLDIPESLRRY
jgi:hypothetical protein